MILITNQHKIKQNIRNNIRSIRKNLTKQKQHQMAKQMTNYIIKEQRIKQSHHIGLFFSSTEEIKTIFLIKQLLYLEKQVYLPIVNPHQKSKTLLFAQYTLSTRLIPNRFKIYEPQLEQKSLIPINQLDILFIPLIAFDNHGNRLGMGGGFYDYTLKKWNNNIQKHLIGLAYDFQNINEILPIETWDVPLPEVITPSFHWIWTNTKLIKKPILNNNI